jgi:hypothetical protein
MDAKVRKISFSLTVPLRRELARKKHFGNDDKEHFTTNRIIASIIIRIFAKKYEGKR